MTQRKCEHDEGKTKATETLCTTRRKRWPCPRRVRMGLGAITKGGWAVVIRSTRTPNGVQRTREGSIQRQGPGGSARERGR